jgi:ribose transport system substrate-binding protein
MDVLGGKKMKTMKWLLSLILLTSVVLASCTPAAPAAPGEPAAPAEPAAPGEPAAPAAPAQAAADEEYIYVSAMGNLEFFNAHKYGWAWGGQALGVKASYVGPAENDVPAMIAAFDQAIAKKPAGIAVFAYDPGLEPSINKAADAGIPVVTILGDLPKSKRIAFVGSYQYDLGYTGGKALAEALGGNGKVAILSLPGVAMFDDRQAGFEAAFKEFDGIEVVQVGDTKADTVTAVNVAKDIMARNPDLAAFVGTDSTAGIGAATAVEEANKVGQVLTVAMDRNSDVLEKIKKGTLTGTVAQDDAAMAFWAMQTLYNYVHNQAPLTVDNAAANAPSGPRTVYTATNYIDQGNLQYYLDANAAYTSDPAPETAAAASHDETYIYVSAMGNLEFFNAHKYGWKWGGETLKVNAEYTGPAENDVPAMIAAFDQAIAKKPAGIAVFAYDPGLEPSINKAADAGIPVVTILGDLPKSKRIAFVGSYQYDLGYTGGKALAEALGGKGQVAILSLPGVQMFDDREAGFRAAFAEFPGIEVVQVGDTKADTVTAVNVAKDIMQRYPDLAAFVGTDSTAGIGAATAVEEANKVGKVLSVAMDRNSDVLEKIKKGTLTGTVAQDDAAMAFWAMQVLYNYVHHQAPLTVDNKAAGASTGPTQVYTATNYIDQGNLQFFLDANSLYTE